MIKRNLLLYCMIFFALISCTTREHLVHLYNRPEAEQIQEHTKNKTPHLLQPGDLLYIKILSLNQDIDKLFNLESGTSSNVTGSASSYLKGFTIDNKGYIKIPVIDTIHIAGLDVFAAEEKIQKSVNKYFNNSTLIIKLLNFQISVLGDVRNPGQFTVYQNDISVFEALALAGDATEYGDKKNLILIRNNPDKIKTVKLDLTDINIVNSEYYFLQPGDVLMVQPVKLKTFKLNAPTISLILSALTTTILILGFAGVGANK